MEWKRIETRWNEIVGRLKQQDKVAMPLGGKAAMPLDDKLADRVPVADPRPRGATTPRVGADAAPRAVA